MDKSAIKPMVTTDPTFAANAPINSPPISSCQSFPCKLAPSQAKERNMNRKQTNLIDVPPRLERSVKKKITVVIIDDDDDLTKNVYRVLLEQEGYQVLTAKDGLSGLNLLQEETNSPDLILVDCSMPKMDGETFLLELKKSLPKIFSESKIVGFTCFDRQSFPFQRIKSLAFDCREKPFGIKGFLQMVSDYLEPQLISSTFEK